MKVRIRDIALAAGVSPATVSNVMNGNNRVSESTKARVLDMARKMGYQDPAIGNERKSIQFIIVRKHGRVIIDSPFFSELISGIESACRKNQYELTISYLHTNDDAAIKALIHDSIRPILLLSTELSDEDVRPFLSVKVPLVVLDSNFLNTSFQSVHIDNIKAGYLAGQCFLRNGHTHVGMITSSRPFNNVRDRRAGFEIALKEHGLCLKEEDVFPVDPTVEGAYEGMRQMLSLRRDNLPTALFAFNDLVAAGAIRALEATEIAVPDQVSVIGMDNIPTSVIINPPLTTIDVPKYAMGYQAVERLIQLNKHEFTSIAKVVSDVALVERESVAFKASL